MGDFSFLFINKFIFFAPAHHPPPLLLHQPSSSFSSTAQHDRLVSKMQCFVNTISFYLFIYLFIIYLIFGVLGLCCCARAFSSCGEQGLLLVAVHGLLIAVASLVVEHGFQVRWLQQLWLAGSVVVAHRLQSAGSVVVTHRLVCSLACGLFPDQGSNSCPLYWQADS